MGDAGGKMQAFPIPGRADHLLDVRLVLLFGVDLGLGGELLAAGGGRRAPSSFWGPESTSWSPMERSCSRWPSSSSSSTWTRWACPKLPWVQMWRDRYGSNIHVHNLYLNWNNTLHYFEPVGLVWTFTNQWIRSMFEIVKNINYLIALAGRDDTGIDAISCIFLIFYNI